LIGFFAFIAPVAASPTHAQAADFLARAAHDFNILAKKATPAVVSITTVKTLTPEELLKEGSPPSTGGEDGSALPFPFGPGHGPGGAHSPSEKVVGIGSGIIIRPDGYILTSNHVVEHATRIQVSWDKKTKYPAHIVGQDSKTDLAVIQMDDGPKNLSTLSFAD